jgi:hypothetical protein
MALDNFGWFCQQLKDGVRALTGNNSSFSEHFSSACEVNMSVFRNMVLGMAWLKGTQTNSILTK